MVGAEDGDFGVGVVIKIGTWKRGFEDCGVPKLIGGTDVEMLDTCMIAVFLALVVPINGEEAVNSSPVRGDCIVGVCGKLICLVISRS